MSLPKRASPPLTLLLSGVLTQVVCRSLQTPPFCVRSFRLMRISLVLLLSTSLLTAADWPEFRGSNAQGQSEATNLPLTWSPTAGIAWKAPLSGIGWSSPV